jgi:hypothetical protein
MSALLASGPTNPQELRPLLHSDVDRLPDSALLIARRFLLEIELQQVTAELDDAADEARGEGRLTPARIAAAVAEHRMAHPHRR